MVLGFKLFLEAGGQEAGSLEVAKMPLKDARSFANDAFLKYQKIPLDQALPNFDKQFAYAQKLAREGQTKRHDMPVIDEKDVKDLQSRLEDGKIDIREPHPKDLSKNPFPQGLSGKQAEQWLKDGLPMYDGGKPTDDIVECSQDKVVCGNLIPIQQQIYFDKCIINTAKSGVEASKKYLTSSTLILSGDDHIIDGHHRWMSAVLIDPKLQMRAMKIHLPIAQLLPLTLAYSDAVGNDRNQ